MPDLPVESQDTPPAVVQDTAPSDSVNDIAARIATESQFRDIKEWVRAEIRLLNIGFNESERRERNP